MIRQNKNVTMYSRFERVQTLNLRETFRDLFGMSNILVPLEKMLSKALKISRRTYGG